MNVAAIDTATPSPSVALRKGGDEVVEPLRRREVFRDAARILDRLVSGTASGWGSVDAIAVMGGPGSFTGLRIGATVGVGLAEAYSKELHAVPSLVVVAAALSGSEPRICASMDARRGRRYAAIIERRDSVWMQTRGPLDVDDEEIERFAGGAARASLQGDDSAVLAPTLSRIVQSAPTEYRVVDPAQLALQYVRPGVEIA